MVIHWHLTFLRQGQVCLLMHLYGKKHSKILSSKTKDARGWIFAYIMWNGWSTKVAKIVVIHWHLTFLQRGQFCFCMHLYGPHTFVGKKMLIISNGFSSEASGPVLLKFHAEPPWAGEWKIAKMGMVHWSKWLPFPYMVKTLSNLLPHLYGPYTFILKVSKWLVDQQ